MLIEAVNTTTFDMNSFELFASVLNNFSSITNGSLSFNVITNFDQNQEKKRNRNHLKTSFNILFIYLDNKQPNNRSE